MNPEKYSLTKEDLHDIFKDTSWYIDFDEFSCPHISCSCKSPDCLLGDYVEYLPKGVVTPDFHQYIKKVIREMAEIETITWHPGSKDQVRDILHPSMYCYIKGVSRFLDGSVDEKVDETRRY